MKSFSGLFDNYKNCEYCRRELPENYKPDLCPHCMEIKLFNDVKEYIRNNRVNEYEVATHFNIPLFRIKAWIREGRIEYRTDDPSQNLSTMHCQNCGEPVNFGNLCAKCRKLMNGKKGFSSKVQVDEKSKMRYLDNDSSEQKK